MFSEEEIRAWIKKVDEEIEEELKKPERFPGEKYARALEVVRANLDLVYEIPNLIKVKAKLSKVV